MVASVSGEPGRLPVGDDCADKAVVSPIGRIMMAAALVVAAIYNLDWGLLGWGPLAADYTVFWEAARIPIERIYDAQKPFVYPPPAIPLFKTLSVVPFWTGFALWTVISAACFYLATARLAGHRVALLSMGSASAFQGLMLGQSPMLLSSLILLAFSVPSFAGGLLLGIVAAMKPQLLVMAPLAILVRRDWPMLRGALVGGVGAVGASMALFGVQPWIDWVKGWPRFYDILHEMNVLESMTTPAGYAESWGLPPIPFLLAGALVGGLAVWRAARRLERADLAALIVGTSMLAVPYALTHDAIGVIPACVGYMLNRPGLKAVPALAIYTGVLVSGPIFAAAAWVGLRPARLPS